MNKLGVRANSYQAQEIPPTLEADVDELARIQDTARAFRHTMASVEGSPLNLCERLTEARDDYVNALAMLFAKAEIVRITLRSCFNLGLDLDSPLRFIDNPTGMLGKVGQWFRSLNLVLEDLRSRERIVTVYRLMRAESVAIGGPSEKDFTAALNHLRNSKESSTTTDARLSFDMDALVRSCAPTEHEHRC